jgi:quercetin dioxygenase-like cupin family protein
MKEKTDFGSAVDIHETDVGSCKVEAIDPGKRVRKHFHSEGVEVIYVLEGNTSKLKQGQLFLFKAGEEHEMVNDSKKPLKLISLCIPPFRLDDVNYV